MAAARPGASHGTFRELAAPFGHHCPAACVPLFVHPQPPAAHRRLQATFGSAALPEVWATPTASYRSVLAWRRGREPVVLKLSLGVKLGGAGRALTEAQVASGVLMSMSSTPSRSLGARRWASIGFPSPPASWRR